MPRRWTPTLAAATALALVAAMGGMLPSAAVGGGAADRATALLTPSMPDDAGSDAAETAATEVPVADPTASEDAVVPGGSRKAPAQAATEHSSPARESSTSGQAMRERYAGEVPSYVYAGPLTLAGVGLSFDHPVAGSFAISSSFGWRLNPTDVGPTVQFHIGQDYAIACGTPVRAAADGLVTSAGERDNGDRRIDIDHGSGLATSYRHNSRLLVSPGDRVSRGDLISLSGTTGNSTGCHLHFDATIGGQYVDPVLLLPSVSGQPRSLDAEELAKLRAAADDTAGDVSRTPSDDTGPEHLQSSTAESAAQRAGSSTDRAESAADRPDPSAKTTGAAARDQPTSAPAKPSPEAPVASDAAAQPAQPASAVPERPAAAKPAAPRPLSSEPALESAKPKAIQPAPTLPEATTTTATPTTPEPTPAEPTTEPSPAQPEPTSPAATPTQPGTTSPSPTQPGTASPSPTQPVATPTQPVATGPSESAPPSAVEPTLAQPGQSRPAPAPSTPSATPAQPVSEPTVPAPEPTSPAPTPASTPTPTQPEPTTSQPGPTPAQSGPTSPEPTSPEPTQPGSTQPGSTSPVPTDPSESEPPHAPETLTDSEAAQWCLPLDDEDENSRTGADADRPKPDFTDVPLSELVDLIATLDEDGEPEPLTEDLLEEVSPSQSWLESLPVCFDAEFREAALEARAAD